MGINDRRWVRNGNLARINLENSIINVVVVVVVVEVLVSDKFSSA
jgi:hypothetical protein